MLKFGLLGSGIGIVTPTECVGVDVCMLVKINPGDGNIAGFSSVDTYGNVYPARVDGVFIFSITFDIATDLCIARMGNLGEDQIPGYDSMAWTFSGFTGGQVIWLWDAVENYYVATSATLTDYIHTQIDLNVGMTFEPVLYDPLGLNPDWQFIQGDNTESYMYSLGRDILKIATGSGQENLVAFKPFEVWNDMEVSCMPTQEGLSQLNSLFAMAIRGVDINNFIGLRFYADYLDVYERKGSVFKSLNQNPVPMSEATGNKVTLRVEGRVVTVLINDVARGDYVDCDVLDTLTAGYCGIVERPSPALNIAHSYSCVERKIPYLGGNATGTLTYLAFGRDPSGIPPAITINAGGVDLTTTLIEISGSQLVVTTAESVTTGQTVLCTIDDTGTNVPQLTNSVVANNTALVTFEGEIVTHNGEPVTHNP